MKETTNIRIGTIQTILHYCFTLSEVSAWWVPGECSQWHRNKCESSDVGGFWSSVEKILRVFSEELLLDKIVQEGARSVNGVSRLKWNFAY